MVENNQSFAVRFYQSHKWKLMIFLSIFIPVGAIKFFIPSSIMTDDFATMAGAAHFAGLDWSRVLVTSPFHGFGLSMFFFPLYLFNLTPSVIILAMRIVNTALLAICGVIAYNTATKIFEIENRKLAIINSIAAACVPYNIFVTNYIWNVSLLILLNWIILYLLLLMVKKIESRKSNIVQSLLLSILLCYGLTVHTRMFFIWGGVFVFILCYLIMNKKFLVNLWVFVPSLLVFYFLVRFFISYIIAVAWTADGAALFNTIEGLEEVFSPYGFFARLNRDGLIAFFRGILGQIYTTFIFTGGLAPLLFVSLVFCFVCLILKKTRKQTVEIVRENRFLLLATVFTIAQIAANILLLSYNQIPNIQTMQPGLERTRWLVYDRYWQSAAAPSVLLAIVAIYKIKKPIVRKLIIISTAFIVLISTLFSYLIAPLIYGAYITSNLTWVHYGSLTFMRWDDFFTPSHILIMTMFAGGITAAVYLLASKKKLVAVSALLLSFFVYHYAYTTINFHLPFFESRRASYRYIVDFFDDTGITEEDYPLVYSSIGYSGIGAAINRNLQFSLYRHSIVPIGHNTEHILNTSESEILIYITSDIQEGSGSRNMLAGGDHKLVDFGEDGGRFYVLVNANDTELVLKIENAGYSLRAFDSLYSDYNGD